MSFFDFFVKPKDIASLLENKDHCTHDVWCVPLKGVIGIKNTGTPEIFTGKIMAGICDACKTLIIVEGEL